VSVAVDSRVSEPQSPEPAGATAEAGLDPAVLTELSVLAIELAFRLAVHRSGLSQPDATTAALQALGGEYGRATAHLRDTRALAAFVTTHPDAAVQAGLADFAGEPTPVLPDGSDK
jgi:hypothetical protein